MRGEGRCGGSEEQPVAGRGSVVIEGKFFFFFLLIILLKYN